MHMKQALWDAYLAAAANQDKADARLEQAQHAMDVAKEVARSMERHADDAHAAWEAS